MESLNTNVSRETSAGEKSSAVFYANVSRETFLKNLEKNSFFVNLCAIII